jgi:hypothetical protein
VKPENGGRVKMASLAWIWKQIGVNEEPWRYDGTIPIPLGGQALVMLRDANGVSQPKYNPNLLTVTKVDPDEANARLIHYLRDLGVRGDVYLGLKGEIERSMSKELHDGSGKLFVVEGKVVGTTTIGTGTNGDPTFTSPYVDVFTPKRYKVSFRFLARAHAFVENPRWSQEELEEQRSEYKKETPETAIEIWTGRSTMEAPAWISHLSWIYGSQAGIKFELGTAEGFYSKKPLNSALQHDEMKNNFEKERDNNAKFTVFLPGRFNYEESNSGVYGVTYPPPDWTKPSDGGSFVTAIADHPNYSYCHYPDQIIPVLAHELSHAIRNTKDDFDDDTEGISSTKNQNTKILPLLRTALLKPKQRE